jgi:hypothetical protein
MKNSTAHTYRLALHSICTIFFAICFHTSGAAYAAGLNSGYAQAGTDTCDTEFGPSVQYDVGEQTVNALHPSGLVLEFHKWPASDDILYRVGKVVGTEVIWGGSQESGTRGYWPAIAISKEGYVIAVHGNRSSHTGSEQYYRIGKIDPYGDVNQSIVWLTNLIHWDGGYKSSLAINDQGVIVGVHEANHSGRRLYYRVGKLRNPAGGDFTIHWDSGQWGIGYEYGESASIAINNLNQIVEVHQVPAEDLLHYRRGTVSGGQIHFGESRRYEDDGRQPAVALLDSGLVLEVHARIEWFASVRLISRTGRLAPSNGQDIEWIASKEAGSLYSVDHPALSTNGTYAIQTHELDDDPEDYGVDLYSSVARICEVP